METFSNYRQNNSVVAALWLTLTAMIVAAFATTTAATGAPMGFEAVAANPTLSCCVDWLDAATMHSELWGSSSAQGMTIATGAAAAAGSVGSEATDEPDDDVRDINANPGAMDDLVRALADEIQRNSAGDGGGASAPAIAPANVNEESRKANGVEADARETPETVEDEDGSVRLVIGDGGEIKVQRQRNVDTRMGVYAQTAQLLSAIGSRDFNALRDIQTDLARAGQYGKDKQEEAQERAVMITGSEGQPFLPVQVLGSIEDIMRQYGAARRLCTVISGLTGSTKVPNVAGRFEAFAVNESSIIQGRKASFGSQSLDPEKWGVIVPWSTEMSEEVGAQIVAKIVELAGEAFARAEDGTVFVADGTAAYHGLTGLLNDTNIPAHVLAAGNTSFGDLGYDDLIDLRGATGQPAVREDGAYVFHPDMEDVFDKMEDGNGRKIFGSGQASQRIEAIRGRDVEYTQAMPGLDTASQADSNFGLFGDFSYVTMGFQRNLTATLLDQATIQDVDDSTLIHLAAQDSLALRFTALWDVSYGLTDAFSKVATPAA